MRSCFARGIVNSGLQWSSITFVEFSSHSRSTLLFLVLSEIQDLGFLKIPVVSFNPARGIYLGRKGPYPRRAPKESRPTSRPCTETYAPTPLRRCNELRGALSQDS